MKFLYLIDKKILSVFLFIFFILENFLFCKTQVVGLTHHPAQKGKEAIPIHWVLRKKNGENVTHPNPSLTLFGNTMSAFGGCNSGSGKMSIEKNTIKFSEIITTEIGCLKPDGILQKEAMYFQHLSLVDRFEWSQDNLTLIGKDLKLEFTKLPLEKDLNFLNTKWNLTGISFPGVVSSVVRDSELYLIFKENGVIGFSGCRKFETKFATDNVESLSIRQLDFKESDCKNLELKRQEEEFLKAISQVDSYHINGSQLRLNNKGETKLYFQANLN